MRLALRTIAALLLVLTLGLHWALLQTVAWTGMVIAYSQDAPLTEAVSKTFDGQHPCPLCQAIQQGREEERSQRDQPTKPGKSLDLALLWQSVEFDFARPGQSLRWEDRSAPLRPHAPPKPRPRAFPYCLPSEA